ncbi:SH3 and PX domain-containing protein 2A-like isoform X1 [Pseudoliparis swirei]|uniref:SH3 and PX domain-containing protein 2A-like isoform X1 n=1 Tax=Pseudoliparis swirei TaxID=2059687 RepID=UPI0024BE6FF2|nr:SH3 and PX domain-containing protein 2A-like isoform X1 [Pseudoliparis swirei]
MQLRNVLDVNVVDVQKRRNPSKHYVYLINVSYSDSTSHVIYRRYSKFFDLQMRILDKFPIEGGQKDPKKRIIPFLPGKVLFRRSHIRDVAVKRLKHLDNYCKALMMLPSHISQSEEVLKFFETKPDDLNPPTEDCGGSGKRKSGLDPSDPMLLDQYVVVASYAKQEPAEISLQAGEVVDVIEKSESGWWFVSTAEEQGWVPATYLNSHSGTRDDLELGASKAGEVTKRHKAHLKRLDRRWTLGGVISRQQSREEKYVTVQPYASEGKDEIAFEKGVTVEVLQKNLEGWWFIRYQDKEGWAPASYLKKMKDDLSPRKKTVSGPVEIIGNIMEISNLLNKKALSEKDVQIEGVPESSQVAKKEISLPIPCADSSPVNSPQDGKSKADPSSPAVARIAPHRVEIGSPVLRQRPPPRRDATLGFQLPSPPEAPTVEAEYYTIADFQSCISDGITFNGGQKAEVIEKNSGGWWYVHIGEKEGWAPCSYIDKRKKPNLNRRTSTLCRPKIPPPAPPVKKQDSVETAPPSSPGSDAPESPVSAGRPVYEEPEYDVPAIGDLDMESEFEFLRGESSLLDVKNEDTSSEKGSHQFSKPSPASSLHSASFKTCDSFEDGHEAGEAEGEGECIYENDGFRPFRETPERQSSRDSNSSKTSVLSETGKTANPTSGGWRPAGNKLKMDLNGSPFSTKAEEASSPKSPSTESTPDLSGSKKDHEESKASCSIKSCTKPKPVVRPKPHLAKASSAEKMDISTLRRQLRPTGQLKNGTKAKGEDSETASVVSSEDSFSSQSTSDLSSIYSKGSRGDSDLEGSSLYRTTDPYEKVQESELSFPAGVEVEVLEKQESGWWYIRWGDTEGWAPTYFLEPARQRDDTAGSESDGTPTKPGSLSKSNSLEKNEQRVQALNNINQSLKKVTPPIPSKPPGGLSKPIGLFGSRKQNSAKQQQVVRPQSVFISAPIRDGSSPVGSLRRNESLNSTDHPRASPTVRRNASFGTVPRSLPPNNIGLPNRNRSGSGSSESLGLSSQRNALPVSTVKPKPHIIHNNLKEVYVSIADYHGDEETMGFPEGTSLEVLDRNPNGWWYCKIMDSGRPRKGWVPSNYLEKKH